MRKIVLCLFLLILFFGFIDNVWASVDSAYSYVLMDLDSGRVYDAKNKDKPMLIASITKIMTCILAIENKDIENVVKVTDVINDSYGSGIYISVGEEIKLKDLLYGLMLRSGNDAAKMIASYVSGSEDEFVKLMNKKAKEIGMKNTIFYNASGLDNNISGNLSTAYDMALITQYAMKNEIYREIVRNKKYVSKSNMKTYVWHNKNKLLQYDYITGGKTGYTEKAKRTLVSTASKNNINLVVVTIKDTDDWNTHVSLYQKIFDNYKSYRVLNKNNFNVLGDSYYDSLYIKNDVNVTLKEDEMQKLISHIRLEKLKDYDDGDKVGENLIYLGDVLVHKEDIYAKKKENVKKSFFSRLKELFKGIVALDD